MRAATRRQLTHDNDSHPHMDATVRPQSIFLQTQKPKTPSMNHCICVLLNFSSLLSSCHLVEEQIVPSRISQPNLNKRGKKFKTILESGMKFMHNRVVWRHLRLTSKNSRTRSFSSGKKEVQSEGHHVSPSPNSVPKCVALPVEDFMSGYYEVRLWLSFFVFEGGFCGIYV
jgi:hypothetical protein